MYVYISLSLYIYIYIHYTPECMIVIALQCPSKVQTCPWLGASFQIDVLKTDRTVSSHKFKAQSV